MGKINDTVRERLNKWFKKQATYANYESKRGGYIVTKNQAEKLKKELWRVIKFFEDENLHQLSNEENQLEKFHDDKNVRRWKI